MTAQENYLNFTVKFRYGNTPYALSIYSDVFFVEKDKQPKIDGNAASMLISTVLSHYDIAPKNLCVQDISIVYNGMTETIEVYYSKELCFNYIGKQQV